MNQALGLFFEQGIPNEVIGNIFSYVDFRTMVNLSSINIVFGELARRNLMVMDHGKEVKAKIVKEYPNLYVVYPTIVLDNIDELKIVLSTKINIMNMKAFKLTDEYIDLIVSYIHRVSPDYVALGSGVRGNTIFCYRRLPSGRYHLEYQGKNYPDSLRSLPYNAIYYGDVVKRYDTDTMEDLLVSWEQRTGKVRSNIHTLSVRIMRPTDFSNVFKLLELLPHVDSLFDCNFSTNGPITPPPNRLEQIRHLLICATPEPDEVSSLLNAFPYLETLGVSTSYIHMMKTREKRMDSMISAIEKKFREECDLKQRYKYFNRLVSYRETCLERKDRDPLVELQALYPQIKFVPM